MAEHGDDPVSAIAEEDAVGEVAEIFADIRATMDIPLLTSIWRTRRTFQPFATIAIDFSPTTKPPQPLLLSPRWRIPGLR